MPKTRRHTFRGDDDDFDRWERAAKTLRLHEFGDFVRRALDDLADHVEAVYAEPVVGDGPIKKRAGHDFGGVSGKQQARPLSKKEQARGKRDT